MQLERVLSTLTGVLAGGVEVNVDQRVGQATHGDLRTVLRLAGELEINRRVVRSVRPKSMF